MGNRAGPGFTPGPESGRPGGPAPGPPYEVDALLFDLGGVVIEIDFGRAFTHWAGATGTPVETIRARFSFDAAYERHERGEIEAAEYFGALRSTLRIDLTDAELAAGWNAIYLDEVAGIRPVLHALADRVPLYAFTNSNPTHQAVWTRRFADVLKSFRKVFVSSEMGLRKPEAGAFAAISREIGVPLARIMFFDDTRANVDGARAIGMPAVHVRSLDDINEAVAALSPVGRTYEVLDCQYGGRRAKEIDEEGHQPRPRP